MPTAEHRCAWQRQCELHRRQVVDLFWENAQLVLLLAALVPGIWGDEPRCVSCGERLRPRARLYCSARCNQRAWRLRKAAA